MLRQAHFRTPAKLRSVADEATQAQEPLLRQLERVRTSDRLLRKKQKKTITYKKKSLGENCVGKPKFSIPLRSLYLAHHSKAQVKSHRVFLITPFESTPHFSEPSKHSEPSEHSEPPESSKHPQIFAGRIFGA